MHGKGLTGMRKKILFQTCFSHFLPKSFFIFVIEKTNNEL